MTTHEDVLASERPPSSLVEAGASLAVPASEPAATGAALELPEEPHPAPNARRTLENRKTGRFIAHSVPPRGTPVKVARAVRAGLAVFREER